jgi:excisionase family DNA binding protein
MGIIETVENFGRALKVDELAQLTAISSKTLYRMISARKLPAFRIGGCVRLEPKTTANWLRSRLA